jgi:hypothetical protein
MIASDLLSMLDLMMVRKVAWLKPVGIIHACTLPAVVKGPCGYPQVPSVALAAPDSHTRGCMSCTMYGGPDLNDIIHVM